jgi:hypothetical protein
MVGLSAQPAEDPIPQPCSLKQLLLLDAQTLLPCILQMNTLSCTMGHASIPTLLHVLCRVH